MNPFIVMFVEMLCIDSMFETFTLPSIVRLHVNPESKVSLAVQLKLTFPVEVK